MTKISVIIPFYNREKLLSRAIESVLLQNDPSCEIIAVDDGSLDQGAAIARSYQGVILIQTRNSGVSAARNRGIRASTGGYIAFLDSDDQWLPGKLARDRDFIENNPQIRIFQSNEIWVRHGVRVNSMRKHQKRRGDIFSESLEMCMISPSSAVMRRDLFDEYGYFDEKLPVCEDYDLWLRICVKERAGLIDENAIVKYGGHCDQLSSSRWGMDRFRLYALVKLYNSLVEDASEKRELTVRAIGKKIAVLRKGAQKHQNSSMLNALCAIETDVNGRARCTDFSCLLQ